MSTLSSIKPFIDTAYTPDATTGLSPLLVNARWLMIIEKMGNSKQLVITSLKSGGNGMTKKSLFFSDKVSFSGGAAIRVQVQVIGLDDSAVKGDAIIRPGIDDGGTKHSNTIAKFERGSQLNLFGGDNRIDAAVASLLPGVNIIPANVQGYNFDPARGVAAIHIQTPVKKLGRTTGLTNGVVIATDLQTVLVRFPTGNGLFTGQIEVKGETGAFADDGDSGSLVIDSNGAAVGLLFGINDEGNGYVNHMDEVLQALNIKLTRQ